MGEQRGSGGKSGGDLLRHIAKVEACYWVRDGLSSGEEEGLWFALGGKRAGVVRESTTAKGGGRRRWVAEWNGGGKKVDAQIRTPAPLPIASFPYLGYGSWLFHNFGCSSSVPKSSNRRASNFDFILI